METLLLPQLVFPENWTCGILPAAWQRIAKAYRTEPQDRTEFEDNLTSRGICYAITFFPYYDRSFMEVIKANRHRLPCALNPDCAFVWPVRCGVATYPASMHHRNHDLMRAEVCEQIAYYLLQKSKSATDANS